jgi:hypothetical protein
MLSWDVDSNIWFSKEFLQTLTNPVERRVWREDYNRLFSQNIRRPYANLIHDRGLKILLLVRVFRQLCLVWKIPRIRHCLSAHSLCNSVAINRANSGNGDWTSNRIVNCKLLYVACTHQGANTEYKETNNAFAFKCWFKICVFIRSSPHQRWTQRMHMAHVKFYW